MPKPISTKLEHLLRSEIDWQCQKLIIEADNFIYAPNPQVLGISGGPELLKLAREFAAAMDATASVDEYYAGARDGVKISAIRDSGGKRQSYAGILELRLSAILDDQELRSASNYNAWADAYA